MKVTVLFTDDQAASSTMGIVLLVGITVILAAVIAGFSFGLLGSSTNSAPNTEFGWEFNGSGTGVEITHQSGDTVDGDRINLGDGWGDTGTPTTCQVDRGDQLSGGDTLVDDGSGNLCRHEAPSGTTLELIWESADGESSTIISERSAP